MAREYGKQRHHQQQNQRQSGIFHRDNRKNRNDAARVRYHADNAGGKKRLHGIHIARKPRGHLAGILPRERAGRQLRQLPRHFRAQRMGHFLSKEHQKALLRGGKDSLQCKAAKIAEHRKKSQCRAFAQSVDHTGQKQRRNQRRRNRRCDTQNRSCC